MGIKIKPAKTISREDALEAILKILKDEYTKKEELKNRLEEAEKALRYYSHDKMFKNVYAIVPNFGKKAREYFDKHKIKE